MIFYLDHIHHENYLRRCIELAELGRGEVAPNPMVGAVLVYQNKIIGEGWHQKYGKAHAEVNCLESVTEENQEFISHATLYVSLEPCAHFGKTPPCANLIVAKKIKKVVIASLDPNPLVAGKGIQILKDNGIEVIEGICDEVQRNLNRRFYTSHLLKRPYVMLKWAQSKDGFIGIENQRVKISDKKTDLLVHQWRAEEQSILVGTRTALIDDPQLNARLFSETKHPIRIVLDRNLAIPYKAHLYNDKQPTFIFNAIENKEISNKTHRVKLADFSPQSIVNTIYSLGIQSVLIEGGAAVLNEFIIANIWDEARLIQSDMTIGIGISAPKLNDHFILQEERRIATDTLFFYRNTSQKIQANNK
ncbi:MAG: bifunctional diaminohydroxyphosphoribosylaminopyrimidine deaminase/5-amino-6-(5-phosphoribosylamino)uracil reductase RibD [Bacteroidetes bacterium]|nr:bifunctional diaminohydroxyphosphoribosylaminopyrimidine deaminase/5-amino-6-(5-phosphoribosylamino)uracil reductase RibD [Bacteroidota bacterium]